MSKNISVILTGELDSGKSTLIGRLLLDTHSLSKEAERELRMEEESGLANLLDSLQEERAGQFTLDTTQAIVRDKKKQYIFIDAPGHKELIKNMLTASSYAEAAIVVIDAQKGMEEQTKRHLCILKFLGIGSIIIAVNKMDAVRYEKGAFLKASEEAERFLNKIQMTPLCYVPVSARYGECLLRRSKKMPWFKGDPLIISIGKCIGQKRRGEFCFPVQDIYNINQDVVLAGRVVSGYVKTGDKVNVFPVNRELRIKRIKVFNKKFKFMANQGEGVGLILDNADGLGRGCVIYKGASPRFTDLIAAKILCIRPLKPGDSLMFLCSTQEARAEIFNIKKVIETADFTTIENPSAIEENNIAEIVIKSDKPVANEEFRNLPELGRFLLQKDSEICAVGIIL